MSSILIKSIILSGACLILGTSWAHQHKKSGMNKKFVDPNVDTKQWEQNFSNENRDAIMNRKAMIDALGLEAGDVVADIGAGTGVFLSDLYRKVGAKGKVYGVEISDGFVAYMRKRVLKEQLSSVEVVRGQLNTTTLPDNSLDVAFLLNVYHHLDHPETMLADFKRSLKKEGVLAIVDFDRVPGKSREYVLKHMKKNKQEFIQEITSNGFSLSKEVPIPFKESFMLLFKPK
jgi:ubiquinone/menaquinone biosynthesis C-methylase UbiE